MKRAKAKVEPPATCSGAGRKTMGGMGRRICPVCHVSISRVGEQRAVIVPPHAYQVRP